MTTTPVFLPGEFCGQRSLVGYSPFTKKSDTTELLNNNNNVCPADRGYLLFFFPLCYTAGSHWLFYIKVNPKLPIYSTLFYPSSLPSGTRRLQKHK